MGQSKREKVLKTYRDFYRDVIEDARSRFDAFRVGFVEDMKGKYRKKFLARTYNLWNGLRQQYVERVK